MIYAYARRRPIWLTPRCPLVVLLRKNAFLRGGKRCLNLHMMSCGTCKACHLHRNNAKA